MEPQAKSDGSRCSHNNQNNVRCLYTLFTQIIKVVLGKTKKKNSPHPRCPSNLQLWKPEERERDRQMSDSLHITG